MSDDVKNQIADMVQELRDHHSELISSMPQDATNVSQMTLKQLHGSPRAFAQACVNAIGEISVLEAHQAIAKYKEEWDEAGKKSEPLWGVCETCDKELSENNSVEWADGVTTCNDCAKDGEEAQP